MSNSLDIERLLAGIKGMSHEDMANTLALLDELELRKRAMLAQSDFLAFIAAVDPNYKFGTHLKRLGALLMQVEMGQKDRIAVSMAPRFGKSQMISIYYPAWYLGKHPDHKMIMASHTVDLAVDMARKVRNLMQTPEYKQIFPGVAIAVDAKAAGKWNTTKGGEVYATGVGGALAGRGAHLIVADDPISEQDIKSGNTSSLDGVYEWFRNGLRTRLMPGGKIAILHTRWHQRDLIGRLIKDGALNEDGDQYDMFEFPAILEVPNKSADPDSPLYDPEAPAVLQKSLWPEQWPLEALLRTKASMPAWQWNAQYQQNPTAQESAIIKKDDIQWWPHERPPSVDFVVQSFDTALTTKDRSDYSVCQTWGVWQTEDGVDNVILLNCVKGKYEFPELKRMALQQYEEWQPDAVIVEAKASGQPLIDEMRRSGLFVQDYSPGKGQDKIARMNAISDMFASKQVWFPETRWATDVVDELLAFPAGEHDDQCFVKNTKITMFDGGECDIIDVHEGDLVWTPTGPQRVVASTCSNPAAVVVEVTFADGRVLRGTANHPVYVPAVQAFIPLGNLQQGDFVCTSKYFATGELTTVDTVTARTHPCAATSTANETVKTNPYIAAFGKMPMALYQRASKYITSTTTLATTGWKTLSALVHLSMERGTLRMMPTQELCTNANGLEPIQKCGSLSSPHGMNASPAQSHSHHSRLTGPSFVQRAVMTCITAGGRLLRYASSAVQSSKHLAPRLHALWPVKPSANAAEKLSGTSNGTSHGQNKHTPISAKNALLSTQPTGLSVSYVPKSVRNPEFYGCSVSGVRELPKREAVYALQVEGNPVFYANGVLVHNCDALTLGLMRIRKGGMLRLHTDHEEADLIRLPSKKAYY